jgi:two-component system, chemotaxis family, response regulator Rcp1
MLTQGSRTMPNLHSIDILLVEDNPADVRLAQETLKDYKLQNQLYVVRDGESALAFLRRQGAYADAPTPDLILLDTALPRLDGAEVLAEIRRDPGLSDLPVVVMASSPMDEDMLKDLQLDPDCVILKPLTFERYLDAVRCFPHLGLRIVRIATA